MSFHGWKGHHAGGQHGSTVEVLARFAMLQFRDGPSGVQVLRGSTLREMQRVHWLEPDWQAALGLGLSHRSQAGKTSSGMVVPWRATGPC